MKNKAETMGALNIIDHIHSASLGGDDACSPARREGQYYDSLIIKSKITDDPRLKAQVRLEGEKEKALIPGDNDAKLEIREAKRSTHFQNCQG
uniref:Uncharacterized protein n=1 Tax=Romanomermis culicivorax TaxID=13658 RepID=A0A915IIH0_ROMCU